MKKLIFALLLFCSFSSFGQSDLLPSVAWRTLVQNVIMLTDSTYRVTVDPIDYNEPGAVTRTIGNYLKDYVGNTYQIIDSTSTTITVWDKFRKYTGPQTDRMGIVYRSVGGGDSPYLAPIFYTHLDKSAFDYSRQFELEILWDKADQYAQDSANIVYWPDTLATVATKYDIDTLSFLRTEIDGSVSNELQTISTTGSAGNITLSNGGGTLNLNVNDADASTTNEIQDLSGSGATLSGYTISLSGDGTSVVLPSEADGSTTNELQTLTTSGTPGNIGISNGNTLNINVDDADPSATNELQTLSFTSPNLSISSGNSVNISGINTDSQTLSTSGAAGNISISGGNTINLNVNDADASTTNELNTSMTWNDATNTIGVVDAGGTKSVEITGFQPTLTTGDLTESVTGLQFNATRQVIGGAADLSLTSGYEIPTTTSIGNWNTAYSWGNHATAGYALAANYVPYIGATQSVNLGAYNLTGNQLISTVATGTAPLSVASTTVVPNLNASYIAGHNIYDLTPSLSYHFPNGRLVRTDIPAAINTMIYGRLEGNTYTNPIGTTVITFQAYNYNTGNYIGAVEAKSTGITPVIYLFNYDGYFYLWFAQTYNFESWLIDIKLSNSDIGNNRVISVTDAVKPTTGVTREASFTPRKIYNNSNFVAGTHYQAPIINPVTGTGSTNYLTKWTGLNTVGSSQIYDDGTGKAGIGMTNIPATLSVGTSGIVRSMIAYFSESGYVNGSHYGLSLYSDPSKGTFPFYFYNNYVVNTTPVLSMDRVTNSVGIGVEQPAQKLDVNGNIRVRGVGTNTTSTVLGLDSNGDLTTNVTITGGATWKGGWNASTNTPTLSDATGTNGWWYKVTVAGTQNLGSGSNTYAVGDDVIHNGTVWQKFSSSVTETDPVFVASDVRHWTTTDSTYWRTAYNDKINSAAFSGTTTKTLTLTQQDGGTVTANFTDNDTYASTTTGNLTENITGLEFSATRQVIGGATELRLSTGYGIPTTTQIGQIHAAGSDNQTLTIGGTTSPTIALSGSNTATFTGGTGIAFSQSGGTITANHTNAVTAGNAGPTASGSLTFGGTFTVPYATYDAQGHITGTANRTLTMPANPDTDTNTKYSISSATATGGGANLRLNGTDATTDDVKFIGSGATTVSYTDANTITVSSTDNNTTSLPVKNSAGTTQFTADQSAGVRFTGSGATTVSYTPASQLVTISSTDNNTNYWTQASGALYPATITDEVRIGATTDKGTYKLQVTGDTWLNGMTNMTGKIYASGITNTSATHTLYYNPGTDEVTYGKSLYITKDYSLTGYATSKYVLYGLDHVNGTMKKLVSSANLSFDQHSFIYNGDIYCIGANRKSIWKVNLTTYAVTKVTTSDYSGFITSMYSENGYIYLTLSRDATGIPTYVYTISTNANTFYGYLFIGEKNPIVEIKAGLNCIIAVSISSEIFATPKWSSKTTKGTAWNRFLDLNDQTFPPGLTVSYLNNVSGVDNFLIFRQNGFSRIASVSTASSACTATLTADNSFIDGYVPKTGDDIFTKMSSMSNVRFPISSSVSWFNGTSVIDGGLYLSNITNTTSYVHTRITDQSATAMNFKVVDQLNNEFVYIFAHGGGVISYSTAGYNDILTMKEIYLLNSDNVVVERVVDNLTFIHLN